MGNDQLNDRHKRQIKDIQKSDQVRRFFEFLQEGLFTCSMASEATGIPQKNLCRYKRKLEKSGLLWQVKKSRCQLTGFLAWYLTTDPDRVPNRGIQLNLFPL